MARPRGINPPMTAAERQKRRRERMRRQKRLNHALQLLGARKIDEKVKQKWEERLRKEGLGVAQPITDNSDGETLVTASAVSDEMGVLRKKVDGNDGFMSGHQTQKVRDRERVIPPWTSSDREVRRVLFTAFPLLDSNHTQRRAAGVWMRVIQLYWRMGLPRQVVAREMSITKEELHHHIQHIRFAEKGLDTKGRPRGTIYRDAEKGAGGLL